MAEESSLPRRLILLLCWGFVLLNIVYLVLQFIEFPTSAEVLFNHPAKMEWPKFTIYLMAIDGTHTKFDHPPSAIDILESCSMRANEEDEEEECDSTYFNKGILGQTTYYTFENLKAGEAMEAYKYHEQTTLVTIRLNISLFINISYAQIYLHAANSDKQRFDHLGTARLSFNRTLGIPIFDISYEHYITKKLPAPYNTKCLDYRTVGLQSQSHCIGNCMQYISDMDNDADVTGFLYQSSQVKPTAQNIMTGDFNAVSSLGLGLQKHCEQMCLKVDCIEHFFVTSSSIEAQSYNTDILTINIIAQKSPTKYTTYIPNYSAIVFICLLCNCIPFWFGSSPYSLLIDVYELKWWEKIRFRCNRVSPLTSTQLPLTHITDQSRNATQLTAPELNSTLNAVDGNSGATTIAMAPAIEHAPLATAAEISTAIAKALEDYAPIIAGAIAAGIAKARAADRLSNAEAIKDAIIKSRAEEVDARDKAIADAVEKVRAESLFSKAEAVAEAIENARTESIISKAKAVAEAVQKARAESIVSNARAIAEAIEKAHTDDSVSCSDIDDQATDSLLVPDATSDATNLQAELDSMDNRITFY